MRWIFLVLLLFASDVQAEWLRLPVDGTGTEKDSYRPRLPAGVKGFTGRPSLANGVPTDYIVWIRESGTTLPSGGLRLTRQQVINLIGSRAVEKSEKLPVKTIRESAIRLWRWTSRHVGTAVAWALSDSDNFNRSDGGLGANWTTVTDYNNPTIVSEKVRPDANDSNTGAYYNAITPANDQWVQWTVATWNDASVPVQRGLLRVQTDADTLYSCAIEDDSGSNPVAKIQAKFTGSTFDLSTDTISDPIASDVVYCEIVGEDIDMKINAVSVLTASNASIASGRVGLGVYGGVASASEMDNWSGGDFVVGGGGTSRRVIIS